MFGDGVQLLFYRDQTETEKSGKDWFYEWNISVSPCIGYFLLEMFQHVVQNVLLP